MLTKEQGLSCMVEFLSWYYDHTKADAIADLLGDIDTVWLNSKTADPAAWQDWLDAIRAEVKEAPLIKETAYMAMYRFLLEYEKRINFSGNIGEVLRDLAPEDTLLKSHSILWDQWQRIVMKKEILEAP